MQDCLEVRESAEIKHLFLSYDIHSDMKIRFCLLNALLCMALSSMAVPAKRGVWRLMTLTDGTEVRVQLVGDEFMHYYVSEDGTKYVMDATTGQGNRLDPTASLSRVKKAAVRRAKVQSRQKLHLQKAKAKQNSFRGTRKGLVILAEFSDRKFQSGHDLTLYK